MITITKDGNSIKFTFDNNGHYLQDGTIEVPINSLSLITDDSGMATFKKSASNDIFISATYEELGMTKAQLETFYKENMVGEVGGSSSAITSGEVQSMIDESISGKADSSAVTESIEAATSGKQNTLTAGFLINIDDFNDEISVDMPTLQANVDNWINDAVASKAEATAVTAINNSLNELDVEATEETKTPVLEMTDFNDMTTYTCMSNLGGDNFIMILEKNEFFMRPWGELYLNFRGMNMHWEGTMMFMLNGNSLDISAQNVTIDGEQYNYSTTIPFEDKMVLDLRGVFPTIMAEISFNIQNRDMDSMFSKISFYNDAVVSTFTDWKTNVNNTIDAIDDKEQALAEALYDLKDEKADTSAVTEEISAAVSGKVDTSTFETYSGTVETALSGKVDTSAITSSVTSASTDSQVPSAKAVYDVIDAKQDQLIAGSGITISGNVISADGGGGKAVSAGTNISVTTGETADTISCTLPITATSDNTSLNIGVGNTVNSNISCAIGLNNRVGMGKYDATYSLAVGNGNFVRNATSLAIGYGIETINYSELGVGQFNVSNRNNATFGGSGNTLFSLGNGTDNNARHNAFEIRQNGDIYITSGGTDIKLQDNLGGGGGSITIDPTLDSGSTNAVANSAITNAINSKQEKGNYLAEVAYDQTNKEALFYSGPYVQGRLSMYDKNDTDNLLANKVDTSAITSSVTSASTDSEVPTAKAVHDAISAGGGGGGLDDDTQLLLSTALTDLNDRKADLSEVKQNYQRKGDYATKSELAAKANVSDVMTLEKAKENEQVTSYALNNLNDKFGGMKLVKITESEYAALTTKNENTLYVVIADPE